MSISDQMLSSGALPNLDFVHGEVIKVLGGAKAGQAFTARHETRADDIFAGELSPDPRAKDVLYFSLPGPGLETQDVVQTEDGRKWKVGRREFSAYLEEQYDIIEFVAGKDS